MSLQPLEARVVPVRLCGYFPHCLLVDCSSWMNPLHLWSSMYGAPSTKTHCLNSKDLHNSSQLLAACNIYWLPSNQRLYGSSPSHISSGPRHKSTACNKSAVWYILELCKCQVRLAVSVLHICSAEDGYKWDCKDLCDSTCVGFLRIGLCAFPPSRRARLLIGHLVATTLTIWQNLVHMCVHIKCY